MATVREILAWAIPRLADAGVDSPRLDAELLLGHVLGRARSWIWSHPEYVLTQEERERWNGALARRLTREPLPYILGEWEFYGRPFTVTPAVLIPRPETELLVEEVLAWMRAHHASRVADIGTGSGAIAVTLAAESSDVRVIAVDLSPAALAVARGNAARHDVEAHITFLQGDLVQPIRAGEFPPLDVIAANLPYIAVEEMAELMPEVRDYEPSLALQAAEGGLAVIRRLIDESPAVLVPGGLLALEVGAGQADKVAEMLTQSGWHNLRVVTDYGGIPRHVFAESPLC